MAKPIINKIIPFDATSDYIFSFSYIGNQPYKNRIVIRNASTNEIVKDETISEMRFQHPLQANILTNGTSYTVQVSVFDENDDESVLSDKVLFTCYTTPSFSISGLSSGENYVKSSSYAATIDYSQKENRDLQSYRFYLYDASYNVIDDSGLTYAKESPYTYSFNGLSNETVYYIRCKGITVDSVEVDTDYLKIYTQYNVSNYSGSFTISNNYRGGYVQFASNIVLIDGIVTGDYTVTDGVLSFADGDSFVEYKEGLLINGNHKVGIRAKNFRDGLIWSEGNEFDTISLFHYKYEGLDYFKLVATNELSNYILYSPRVKLDTTSFSTIYITRDNNIFGITIL